MNVEGALNSFALCNDKLYFDATFMVVTLILENLSAVFDDMCCATNRQCSQEHL